MVLRASRNELSRIFDEWDTDGRGVVTRTQFRRGNAALGIKVRPQDLNRLFDSIDADGDGLLTIEELMASLAAPTNTGGGASRLPSIQTPRASHDVCDDEGVGFKESQTLTPHRSPIILTLTLTPQP